MIAHVSSSSWWSLILQALALVGIIGFFMREVLVGFRRLLSWLVRPVTYVIPTELNIHPDPTRPNFMEDENAAWVNVTSKMQQFEKRAAIQGKKKS